MNSLAERGWKSRFSPEAASAAAAWSSVEANVESGLRDCASGRELIDAGYPHDVAIASELDDSSVVPILRDDRFVEA